jgi:esterase/lipase superfamily enzyme
MHRSYHQWHSTALDRTMELLVFGHAGALVLVFPTSNGRFYDYEEHGMIEALRHPIEQGWFQLICLDSIDGESWYNYGEQSGTRLFRHDQYEGYILTEVIPFARQNNPHPYLIVTGCSFGASHAINFGFRHPESVNRIVALSGLYDLRRFFGGDTHDSIYFHNPVEFMQNMPESPQLDAIRKQDIILAIGKEDPAAWSNDRLSQILWSKNVWHAMRWWNGWAHDWPYWQQMIQRYIGGHD